MSVVAESAGSRAAGGEVFASRTTASQSQTCVIAIPALAGQSPYRAFGVMTVTLCTAPARS